MVKIDDNFYLTYGSHNFILVDKVINKRGKDMSEKSGKRRYFTNFKSMASLEDLNGKH